MTRPDKDKIKYRLTVLPDTAHPTSPRGQHAVTKQKRGDLVVEALAEREII